MFGFAPCFWALILQARQKQAAAVALRKHSDLSEGIGLSP
jgi:hypothetical protein